LKAATSPLSRTTVDNSGITSWWKNTASTKVITDSAVPAQSADAIYLLVDRRPSSARAWTRRREKRLKVERPSKISWSSLFVDGSKPFVVISSSGSVEAYDVDAGTVVVAPPASKGIASPTVTSDLLIIDRRPDPNHRGLHATAGRCRGDAQNRLAEIALRIV
jgi:hypothetical protein